MEESKRAEIYQNMQMHNVNYSYTDNFTVVGKIFIDAPQPPNSVT